MVSATRTRLSSAAIGSTRPTRRSHSTTRMRTQRAPIRSRNSDPSRHIIDSGGEASWIQNAGPDSGNRRHAEHYAGLDVAGASAPEFVVSKPLRSLFHSAHNHL